MLAREPVAHRRDVLVGERHRRVDVVRNPAGEFEAARDRVGGEQRVVDAAEPHADHEHDRHAERDGEIGHVLRVVHRHAEAAGAFDDDDLRARQRFAMARDDRVDVERHAFLRGDDMRRGRRLQQERRAQLGRQHDVRGRVELVGVLVAPHAVAFIRAGRDGFQRGRAQAMPREAVQHRGRDEGLADFGVGAGNEQRERGGHAAVSRRAASREAAAPRGAVHGTGVSAEAPTPVDSERSERGAVLPPARPALRWLRSARLRAARDRRTNARPTATRAAATCRRAPSAAGSRAPRPCASSARIAASVASLLPITSGCTAVCESTGCQRVLRSSARVRSISAARCARRASPSSPAITFRLADTACATAGGAAVVKM